jgi:hypothetical protein
MSSQNSEHASPGYMLLPGVLQWGGLGIKTLRRLNRGRRTLMIACFALKLTVASSHSSNSRYSLAAIETVPSMSHVVKAWIISTMA